MFSRQVFRLVLLSSLLDTPRLIGRLLFCLLQLQPVRNHMHRQRLVFIFLLAALQSSAAVSQSPNFVPSPRITSNWNRLAGTEVVGQIRRFEPWEKFADENLCRRAPEMCATLAANLRVGLAEIAKTGSESIVWPVVIPIAHKLREEDFIRFRMPEQPALAQPVTTSKNQILTTLPSCRWSDMNETSCLKTAGVVCDDWSYHSLDYLW